MLRPEEMTRVVVVGSIDSLDATIECLYELGVLHLIDFTKQDEEFKIGRPLSKASAASQKLLKLRSMIRTLEIEEHKPGQKLSIDDINKELEQALVTLDLNTSSKAETRQKILTLMREKEGEVRALTPFRSLGIHVEDYEGYDNISSFTGTCLTDPTTALESAVKDIEVFAESRKGDLVVAVFVRNEKKAEVAKILAEHNFQEIKMPKLKGSADEIISSNLAEVKDLETDLKRIESDIESIRKKFADFIVSSEEYLAIEVLKAETPLRIASSENSFIVDGWIPVSKVQDIQVGLDALCCGLSYVETVQPEKEEEPPVKLRNPKLVGPFEFFIGLVSTPKYEEIDPTLVLFITFPLFFGFMVGDLGFGLGLVALGAVMRWKLKGYPDLYRLGAIIVAGGVLASIFGLFVFAEAFGVPFHPPAASPDEDSWEALANIPIHPMLDKMRDIKEMLAISLVAGWLHLSLGFGLGFVNNYDHNKKHAVAKVAWFIILFGLFAEIMTIAGSATATSSFINSTVLAPLPDASTSLASIKLSLPAVVFIVIGVIVLPFTEGALALTEVIGLFTNLVSYTRLAALAVGKGAMALAFNSMLFPLIFESNNIGIIIGGAAALFVTQMFFVFFLGSLSAGIQAIRLNYVEFFLKFFEGGGTDFSPLKYERKYSMAEAKPEV
jgi:V/A-type H+-transporting ATPase subunit I